MKTPCAEPGRGVAAVVVTYQPELSQLQDLLRALRAQVQWLILVDNASDSDVSRRLIDDDVFIPLRENLGLAAAQNIGIERALAFNPEFVYLSDQDSLPMPGMIALLVGACRRGAVEGASPASLPIAAVGPASVDARTGRLSNLLAERNGWPVRYRPDGGTSAIVDVGMLIASGSLLPADAIRIVGGMRSKYFIDHVDTEWCRRARAAGYRLLAVPAAQMQHRLGDAVLHFWLFRWRSVQFHSPLRDYYMIRNSLLMLRDVPMGWGWRWLLVWRRFLVHPVYLLILGDHRLERIRLMLRGFWDGLHGRGGRLDPATGRLMPIAKTGLDP